MTFKRIFIHILVFVLLLVPGLSQAAQSELVVQDNAPEAPTRYYVVSTGTGSGGKSWTDAFTNLQDALSAAVSGDEIWVAAGVYYPDQGVGQIDNERTSTFELKEDVALYGGFDTGDKQLSDRDWQSNLTVLSGNFSGDNAYHVVSASGVGASAILDGFTITAGQADGLTDHHYLGGGFYCDGIGSGNECSPSLSNLTFSGNSAGLGGGMYNDGKNSGTTSPSLRNVTFFSNSAELGGAMYNDGTNSGTSSPSLRSVTFTDNSAKYNGGAIYNDGSNSGTSSPDLRKVTFSGNSADLGGAMYNNGDGGKSSPSLRDVSFTSNSAGINGGAMYNNGSDSGDSSPDLKNVDFAGNSATGNGGAIFNNGVTGVSNPNLINVKFSGNKAGGSGGAMFNDGRSNGDSSPILTNVTFSGNSAGLRAGAMYNFGGTGASHPDLRNNILWNNQDSSGIGTLKATIRNDTATTTVTHSLVQDTGGSSNWTLDPDFVNGGGNIDEDPKFVTPVNPSTAPTRDGNLRLKSSSPAIDAGKNSYVSEWFDLDNLWRIRDGDDNGVRIVDMGAYEYPSTVPYEIFGPVIYR